MRNLFSTIGAKLSDNREMTIALITSVLVLVMFGGSYMSKQSEYAVLESEQGAMIAELQQIEDKVNDLRDERDEKRSSLVEEETGLNIETVRQDALAAESYFKDAFEWIDGTQYDMARNRYMESLGEDNSFTKSYMPENIKIETNDGDLSYVDGHGIKSKFNNMAVTPLAFEGDTIRYVGIVEYYVYKSERDLNNLNALDKSMAILLFTTSRDEEGRNVSEVKAWNGFSTVGTDSMQF